MRNLYKPGYFWENVPQLEKRALSLEDVKRHIASIWRDHEGPFQNIFRIATYALPFVSGAGLLLMIVDKIASHMWGMGVEDFGAWLDKELKLGPGSNVGAKEIHNVGDLIGKALQKAASADDGQLEKTALLGIGALLRFLGGAGGVARKVVSALTKLVLWVITAFGLTKLGDMYNKPARILGSGVSTELYEQARGMFGEQSIQDLMKMFDISQIDKELAGAAPQTEK